MSFSREVTEAKSLAQRLEGYVAYEKDLASQEHRAQQNDHMLLRDESRRREVRVAPEAPGR